MYYKRHLLIVFDDCIEDNEYFTHYCSDDYLEGVMFLLQAFIKLLKERGISYCGHSHLCLSSINYSQNRNPGNIFQRKGQKITLLTKW